MDQFFPKKRLLAFILLGIAMATHDGLSATTFESASSPTGQHPAINPLSSGGIHLNPKNHSSLWATQRTNKRSLRSVEVDGSRRSCNTLAYHVESQIGHQASCPFEWLENYEARRIPRRIVEQVCRSCRSCGYSRQCVQLKVRTEVFFGDTGEYGHQFVRAGCACMPFEIGSTANPFDIEV